MNTNNNKTMALVGKTIDKDDVMDLLNMTLGRQGRFTNSVSIYKGRYTTWDGEVHTGYIVCHCTREFITPELTPELRAYAEAIGSAEVLQPRTETHENYYFMEVTLEEVENHRGDCHLWEPTFHMLMPISAPRKQQSKLPEQGTMEDLVNHILDVCTQDDWDYISVPMTEEEIEKGLKKDRWYYSTFKTKLAELTYDDIYGYWHTPLTKEEQEARDKAKEEYETELFARFYSDNLPEPESDDWYYIIADIDSAGWGDYTLERKAIEIMKMNGHSVYIDGERDSFGWVTRGIWVDDIRMCLM